MTPWSILFPLPLSTKPPSAKTFPLSSPPTPPSKLLRNSAAPQRSLARRCSPPLSSTARTPPSSASWRSTSTSSRPCSSCPPSMLVRPFPRPASGNTPWSPPCRVSLRRWYMLPYCRPRTTSVPAAGGTLRPRRTIFVVAAKMSRRLC
ncbi:hypothetical protein CCHR01_18948, partial [Colletotrichum chrysophilum]